jgi:hypothetical protein
VGRLSACERGLGRSEKSYGGIFQAGETLDFLGETGAEENKMIKTAFGTCSLGEVPLSFRLLAETNSGWLMRPTSVGCLLGSGKQVSHLEKKVKERLTRADNLGYHVDPDKTRCHRDESLKKLL